MKILSTLLLAAALTFMAQASTEPTDTVTV